MKVFSTAALLGGLLLQTPQSPGAETLQGRVFDRAALADGAKAMGIGGAKVILYDTAGRRLAAKITASKGAYRFAGVKPGRYLVAVERKEFLPSPLVRAVEVGRRDTLARDFALDRVPRRNQAPARDAGKRKTSPHGYYARLAQGMLAQDRPSLFRDASLPIGLGRFIEAEDTTAAWRGLWAALLWAEVESQDRPVEHRVFLAHALDSALEAAGWPPLPALATYLKVDPDSLEAYTLRARAAILVPPRQPGKGAPDPLRSPAIPRTLAFKVLEGHLASPAIPLPKKRAFLARARASLGADAARRLLAGVEGAERARKDRARPSRRKANPGPPAFDSEALWKVVAAAAAGKRPNPVALYHVGYRHLEAGRHPEALGPLQAANAARPGYARALLAEARVHMAMGDSGIAETRCASLSELEATWWRARGWQCLANLQWRSGRAESAEASLVKSLGLDAGSDSARSALALLAGISLERGTWSTVIPLLEERAGADPLDAEVQYWLGRMALKGKREEEALARYRRARSLDPARAEYAVAEAAVLHGRERCGDALELLKPRRSRLDPEGLSLYGRCLLAQGRAREAAEEFARLHKARPSAASLALWAGALNAAGKSPEAAALLADSPFNSQPGIRFARAETHLALRQAEAARDALEPLRARSPEDPRLHYLLARCAWLDRNYPEASKELTEALRYRQDYPEAVHLQGGSLLKLGRAGEAHHYFGELAGSGSRDWRAKGLAGRGQAFAQQNRLEEGVDHLERSFRESPTAEAAAHLALVHLRREDPARASEWAAKARRLDPGEPLALMAAADALASQGRQEEALALAADGLARHPGSCDFQLVAAKVSLNAGRDAEARDLSLQAARSCPGEPAPHYYLGSLSARAGVSTEARRHFGAYLAAGGDAKRVPAGYR